MAERPISAVIERAEIERQRAAWSEQFGGAMVEFDTAYHEALDRGLTIAEAQAAGVNAVLDAFVQRLIGGMET